ncbi:HAD family hydrolase [Spiroplasma endosymbiont of Cantharis rufa]|uniref:Cof-type HAD-IIB family hydrolase n=1 Tax=Spiroplasma endosymbiont of Cantharis rufa TaxID=3066279 RepID=UPI0030CDED03
MIKLIALDIDGTLVKRRNLVSKTNIKAIKEARKKGIKICIATGRNISRAKNIAKAIGLDSAQEFLISLNGGATFKYNEKAEPIMVEEHLFELEDFKYIYDVAKENKLSCFSYAKDPNIAYVLKKDLFTYVLKKFSHRKLIRYNRDTVKDTSYKIVVYGKPSGISDLKEKLKDKEFEMFSWSYVPHSSNVEINPKGVDKLYSLQNVAKSYGIKAEEIMYFGDSDNDQRAIEWVGQGIAMGNSKKHLKELASNSTKTNKKHGVGYWIQKTVLV